MGALLRLPLLHPLPDFQHGETDTEIRTAWKSHKGWWRSDGSDACEECDSVGIPSGQPMYLTGEPGVILCGRHAPVAPPRFGR